MKQITNEDEIVGKTIAKMALLLTTPNGRMLLKFTDDTFALFNAWEEYGDTVIEIETDEMPLSFDECWFREDRHTLRDLGIISE